MLRLAESSFSYQSDTPIQSVTDLADLFTLSPMSYLDFLQLSPGLAVQVAKSLYIRLYLCISRPKSGSSPDHFVLISMLSLFYSTERYMGWIAYTCTLFTLLVRIVNATFCWLFDSFQSGVFGKQCFPN